MSTATVDTPINVSLFSDRCAWEAYWPAGRPAVHKELRCTIRLGDIPESIRAALAPHVGTRLDDLTEVIDLGVPVFTSRDRYEPRPDMTLGELAECVRKSVLTREERQQREREAHERAKALEAEEARRRTEEAKRLEKERQAELQRQEQERRRRSPAYALECMEKENAKAAELAEKLEKLAAIAAS